MADTPSKAYAPADVENKWRRRWLDAQAFRADPASPREPYSIVIPPPNVTGVLHLGHVLNNTIQDVLARRARMRGSEVLWLPGTDHAGIATQNVVERELDREGLSRQALGREAFVRRVESWREKHGGIILEQLQRLGCSCDWSRERYTQDPAYVAAVLGVFVELYRQGHIYRGVRMVNWCPKTQTALSDEEVVMETTHGFLYYMRYEVIDSPGRFLEIATTRPETLMGDTAVAVHPADARYRDLIGMYVRRPFPEAPIPVIGDEHIDPEFGTGVLKVTPAHDRADFEIGQRHGLPIRDILNPDGTLNDLAGPDFTGLDRAEAREKAAGKLEAMGLLVRREPYENEVGYSERAGVPIEPRLSLQWFLRYPSVDAASNAVASGQIRFRPDRWTKSYAHWMENIQDWCISRQLWWGHRIPVWYPRDRFQDIQSGALSEEALRSAVYVGLTPPPDPENWIQDDDVLDTWFSSWLWPFATMDGPTRERFYPTTDLVTAPDILFFWVARMIMAGLTFTGQIPFRNVFFTGLIRDSKGRKLSKSLGNSPDCLELLDRYGADGVRFGLLRIAPTGSDIRYDEDRLREGRNFATKLWNAVRFRLLQGDASPGFSRPHLSIHAIESMARLNEMEQAVAQAFAGYRFNEIAGLLYEFFWSHYCDWFLESIKEDLQPAAEPARRAGALQTMDRILLRFLLQLHPIMPHITEELWEILDFGGGFLMQEPLPAGSALDDLDPATVAESRLRSQAVQDAVRKARNMKAAYGLGASRNVSFILRTAVSSANWLQDEIPVLRLLAGAARVEADASYRQPRGVPGTLTELGEIFMPLEGLVDTSAEKARISRELVQIDQELNRVESRLGNPSFVDRAPSEVIEENRRRRSDLMQKRRQLLEMLDILEG
ncbi:MAG TPA: valine--tRNA ligase [Verrucomicrobiales bacterium]|nr:valine--tRNA ligase [Verrucomicrobiales bacterium]